MISVMFKQICNKHDNTLHVFHGIATSSQLLYDNNSCYAYFVNEIIYLSWLELGKHKSVFYIDLKWFSEWNVRTMSSSDMLDMLIITSENFITFCLISKFLWFLYIVILKWQLKVCAEAVEECIAEQWVGENWAEHSGLILILMPPLA